MKIIVSTHNGKLYDEEIDYVLVHNQDGEFAIMHNHVPIISVITEGYLKLVRNTMIYYIVIVNGVLEYRENHVNVLTGEAHIGKTIENAMENLNAIRAERLSQNKKQNVDYTEKEKELRENIRKSKAGHI